MEYISYDTKKIIIDEHLQQQRVIYHSCKRCFDLFFSSVGLVLLAPLFLIISFAIKVEDPKGSVFYSQTRIGENEKPFRMFKFRSMVSDADELLPTLLKENEVDGAMFKIKKDPRVTKIGKFIRKYSIDELPQLLNVFIGNMSLVGPRPPLPREVKYYTQYDKQRLAVKPGCTGLWQVTMRNDVGFRGMVHLDLEYIVRSSWKLDIYIILRTCIVFMRPNSAY
ncbi:sugar transferase [Lactiplantibacillus songbeiensis]|uniref:Sugar transferase n=1 Tax=Lactiplantibacillus songbeiensis TaxID=2559920 RepID=A0ABW4C4A4_9LACO|nr:sugar transferase [Lactiplantibacillus songbeiensis]